jgi:hypothetical protein
MRKMSKIEPTITRRMTGHPSVPTWANPMIHTLIRVSPSATESKATPSGPKDPFKPASLNFEKNYFFLSKLVDM